MNTSTETLPAPAPLAAAPTAPAPLVAGPAAAIPAVATPNASAPRAPVSALPPSAAVPAKTPRRPLTTVLLVASAIAALAWGAHYAVHIYHYVATDNAYFIGHLHQISSQIDGQVKEVLAQDNQDVKTGDVLVRLDPLEFQIAVQKAGASLAQARAQENQTAAAAAQADAQYAEAVARVAQADAQIAQARAQLELAQLTAARNDQLFGNGGAVTKADVDSGRSALNAAQATLDAATANRNAAQAAVDSAQATQKSFLAQLTAAAANVSAAQAAVRDTERQLSYATIVAPADGRIGNKNVENGNRVLAGQEILALAEPAPWIVANFKETQLPRMQIGQPVEITVDALPGQTLHGRVESLAPASGAQFTLLPPDNATGNFNKVVQRIPVKIVLDPESLALLGDRLRIGYSAIVSVRVR